MPRTVPKPISKQEAKEVVALQWSTSKSGTRYQDVGRVRLIECDLVPGWYVFQVQVRGEPRFSYTCRPRDVATGIPNAIRKLLTPEERQFIRVLREHFGGSSREMEGGDLAWMQPGSCETTACL